MVLNYKLISEKSSDKVKILKEKFNVQSVTSFQSKENLFGVEIMSKGIGIIRGWGKSEREAFKKARKNLKCSLV